MPEKYGYVYILTNPCIQYSFKEGNKMKVISPVKIGFCFDLANRVGTLNTASPENFKHHMSIYSNDPIAMENMAQKILKPYRIKTNNNDKTEGSVTTNG